MAKKVAKVVKMELPGGEAKPGPKLASAGVVMPKFCTEFNAKTADRKGQIVPVIITAYEDKTFSMEIKTSPVTGLLLKAAGIEVVEHVLEDEAKFLNRIFIKNIAYIFPHISLQII